MLLPDNIAREAAALFRLTHWVSALTSIDAKGGGKTDTSVQLAGNYQAHLLRACKWPLYPAYLLFGSFRRVTESGRTRKFIAANVTQREAMGPPYYAVSRRSNCQDVAFIL